MTSVQLGPDIGFEGSPPCQQLEQLHGFAGVLFGYGLEQIDFIAHQTQVGDRVKAGLLDAADVGGKGAPTEDDALVGCGGGHGQSIAGERDYGQGERC